VAVTDPERRGTLRTASHNDRVSWQRLRSRGMIAPPLPGSLGQGPRTLGPKCLQWPSMDTVSMPKILPPAEILPSLVKTAQNTGRRASSLTTLHPYYRTCRLEALAGTSPPLISSTAREAAHMD
jgi:hypothetical protein